MTKRTSVQRWWPFILVVAVLMVACEFREVTTGQSPSQEGTAQLSLSDEQQVTGSVKVLAMVAATGKRAGEATVAVRGQAVLELELEPQVYLLHVHAFADADAKVLLSARSAKLRVPPGATCPVDVKVVKQANGQVDVGIAGPDVEIVSDPKEGAVVGGGGSASASGGGGSSEAEAGGAASANAGGGMASGAAAAGGSASAGGASAGGAAAGGGMASTGGGATGAAAGGAAAGGASAGGAAGGSASGGATVTAPPVPAVPPVPPVAPLCVPVIEDVKVDIGQVMAKIQVKASGSSGAKLAFIWSGAGLEGAVSGGDSLEIPCNLLTSTANPSTHVWLVSKDGVVARVKVTFDITSHLRLGVLKLGGTAKVSMSTSANLALEHGGCVSAFDRCKGGCKASAEASAGSAEAHAACFLTCGLSLANCCESK